MHLYIYIIYIYISFFFCVCNSVYQIISVIKFEYKIRNIIPNYKIKIGGKKKLK